MIYGFSPYGAGGHLVRVEVDIRHGLPGVDIVGLASNEVRESRERVRAAIRNSGFTYPAERILVNLAPAAIPKVGAGLDLAIALATLAASGQIHPPEPLLAIGELSVAGDTLAVRGTLAGILAAARLPRAAAVVPRSALRLLAPLAAERIAVHPLDSLQDLRDDAFPQPVGALPDAPPRELPTFDDMDGQPLTKWACAIAAAGFHNLLLMGPPGSGKTMGARRLAGLLPPLDGRAFSEVARLYSMRGLEEEVPGLAVPLRMPHHSSSVEGMIGGGRACTPGEVSLAHHGVLILDEATEFRPSVLQSLREPIEQRSVSVVRAGRVERFPAMFRLVLTTNLCPCGKLGHPVEHCLCSMHEIERYWRRLGAALLDRVEIRVLTRYRCHGEEQVAHRDLAQRVATAIARQEHRFRGERRRRNGQAADTPAAARLALAAPLESALRNRMDRLGLSDRAGAAVRAVARTIADLDDRAEVRETDIDEASSLAATGAGVLLGSRQDESVYSPG